MWEKHHYLPRLLKRRDFACLLLDVTPSSHLHFANEWALVWYGVFESENMWKFQWESKQSQLNLETHSRAEQENHYQNPLSVIYLHYVELCHLFPSSQLLHAGSLSFFFLLGRQCCRLSRRWKKSKTKHDQKASIDSLTPHDCVFIILLISIYYVFSIHCTICTCVPKEKTS